MTLHTTTVDMVFKNKEVLVEVAGEAVEVAEEAVVATAVVMG